MFKKLKDMYETKAIYIIGFLLSYPIALIATNSLPILMDIERIFFLSVIIWTIIFFLKPIKNILAIPLLTVQILWFFSSISFLPVPFKLGLENAYTGSTKWALFIYEKLYGEEYFMFINWIRNFLLNKDQYFDNVYYNIFIILIISSIMIIVMQLIEKRTNWKVFLAVSLYFIVGWFIYVKGVKGYFSLYFLGVTIYRQYLIYDKQVSEAKKTGERTRYYSFSSAILVGSILMIVVLLVSNIAFLFLPVEKINSNVNQFIPNIAILRSDYETMKGSKIFSFSSTMYSPNKDILGGPIIDRDYSVIMRLKADEGGLYLRGRSKNIYDGSRWSSDFNVYKNNINISSSAIPDEYLKEIIIYPETLISRTVFSPYKYYTSSFSQSKVYGNEDNIVYRKYKTNLGLERYSVKYILQEYQYEYDILDEKLREKYLEVPVGLQNTKELAISIANEFDTDYNKMKALERYLRENYRYTLMTDEVNENEDFVENFLFEEKKGYCTYFASALAVMGRVVDIPTRYIEGFVTSDFVDYEGYYEVSANKAHAWVEAYIEGKGWIRFEPTPAYYNGDEIEEEGFDDSLDSSDGITGESDFDEDKLRLKEMEMEKLSNRDSIIKSITIYDVATILIYMILLLGGTYLIYSKVKRYREDIHKGDYTEKIKNRILYILSMISSFDEERNPFELPTSVITRASLDYLGWEIPKHIIRDINLSLYSLHAFNEQEFNVFNEFFMEYENKVKKHNSPFVYIMSKIVFNTLYHNDYYRD